MWLDAGSLEPRRATEKFSQQHPTTSNILSVVEKWSGNSWIFIVPFHRIRQTAATCRTHEILLSDVVKIVVGENIAVPELADTAPGRQIDHQQSLEAARAGTTLQHHVPVAVEVLSLIVLTVRCEIINGTRLAVCSLRSRAMTLAGAHRATCHEKLPISQSMSAPLSSDAIVREAYEPNELFEMEAVGSELFCHRRHTVPFKIVQTARCDTSLEIHNRGLANSPVTQLESYRPSQDFILGVDKMLQLWLQECQLQARQDGNIQREMVTILSSATHCTNWNRIDRPLGNYV